MSTLCVAGCSYSDRTQVSHCFGDFVSASLNMNYLHLAGGCGSNQRAVRLITEALISSELTKGDTVIWQITDVTRRELPSTWMTYHSDGKQFLKKSKADFDIIRQRQDPNKVSTLIADTNPHYDCVVDDVYTTRFKMGSHQWQQSPSDRNHHAYTEKYAVLEELDQYNFYLDLWRLQSLLHLNNIKLILFWNFQSFKEEVCGQWLDKIDSIVKHQFVIGDHWDLYRTPAWYLNSNSYALDPINGDFSHFSISGHMKIAELLERFIEEHSYA